MTEPNGERPPPLSSVMCRASQKLAKKTGIAMGWHEGDMGRNGPKRYLAGCEICDWNLGTGADLPSALQDPEKRRQAVKQVERAVQLAFVSQALKTDCPHLLPFKEAATGKAPREPGERKFYSSKLRAASDRRRAEETGIAFGIFQHDAGDGVLPEDRMMAGCEICGYSFTSKMPIQSGYEDAVKKTLAEMMTSAAVDVLCRHWLVDLPAWSEGNG